MKKFRKNRGITLIALIITIIVLLILAGVSIATLTGDNGILTRVQDAKTQTEEAEDIEKIGLAITEAQIGENGYQELTTDSLESAFIKDGTKAIVSDNEDGTKHILFVDKKKEYKLDSNGNIEDLNIDFDSKYVAPSSQDEERNEGVIGIGTDGKTVDMDLWNISFDSETGGYVLNDLTVLEGTEYKAGYVGDIVDGKIIGTVPAYIKQNGEAYVPVTNLNRTFYQNDKLIKAPILPVTIKDMNGTFNSCTELVDAPLIPNTVINMYNTFINCSSLMSAPDIPNSVESLNGTFANCNFQNAPKIGKNVKSMKNTFYGCTKLITPPILAENVESLQRNFL